MLFHATPVHLSYGVQIPGFWNTGSETLQGELLVDECLEEASKTMEVTARFDVPDNSHERLRVDQLLERNVIEVQLARNAHHDAIEAAFGKSTIPANTQLATEHDVKRMRF